MNHTKEPDDTVLTNDRNTEVLVCIMNNPGIDTLKVAKKIKMPQASVYRAIFRLLQADLLNTMNRKPGWRGGNSTIMYSAKRKQMEIIINSKGVRIVR